jgi:hypothetical protein
MRYALVVLLILMGGIAWAHGDAKWIGDGGYKNGAGELCCGERDCHPILPQAVRMIGGEYHVTLGAATYVLTEREAQDSIDERYWVCIWGGAVKCFFRPRMGA